MAFIGVMRCLLGVRRSTALEEDSAALTATVVDRHLRATGLTS